MKNRLFGILILTLVLICIVPTIAFADSVTGTAPNLVVTIDITGGATITGLEARVTSANGGIAVTATDIIELFVGSPVSGSFDAVDIAYINTLVNLKVLNVADTITVGNVGNNFCSSFSTTNFDNLQAVTFPSTTFGNRAFRDCLLLTSVTLPNATTFGFEAFVNCESLNSITLPSATTFGNFAFSDCDLLTSVTLPNASTFAGNLLSRCFVLTSVTLPNATAFGNSSFQLCSALTNISLPNATSFGTDTFVDCTSLTSLTLGNTPPTVASWGANLPASKDVNVPIAAVSTYDPDGDGLWESWTVIGFDSLAPVIISNPQSGEACWFNHVIEWVKSLF